MYRCYHAELISILRTRLGEDKCDRDWITNIQQSLVLGKEGVVIPSSRSIGLERKGCLTCITKKNNYGSIHIFIFINYNSSNNL